MKTKDQATIDQLSGRPTIAGGAPDEPAAVTLEAIQGIVAGALKPLEDGVKGAREIAEKALAEASKKPTVSYAPRGFFGGGLYERGDAPAYVRPENLGDQPYSVAKAILSRHTVDAFRKEAPLEHHVSEELINLGFRQEYGGILVPLSVSPEYLPDISERASKLIKLLQHAYQMPDVDPYEMRAMAQPFMAKGMAWHGKAMDPFDDINGGSLLPFPMRGELIDFLRPATVVGQAGAQQISIPPGGIYWPSETGRTTFSRRKPGSQTAITASQPTTGSLKMTPKEMAGLVKIPNPLLRWSMPAAESLVRRALAMDSELACDLDRLEGEGGTDSILGIIRQPMSVAETPTADKVTLHVAKTTGNDGNTFEPEDPGTMLGLVEDAPDINGATAFLMRGGMFWALSNRRADAGQTGDAKGPFMFPFTRGQMGQAVQKDLLGKPVLTSPQIVRTRRKGNSTNLTYVLTGNFNRVVIGRLGALEIAVSTERAFELNETWIRAVSYDDMVITHPQSLVFCDTLVQA